jgi:hypothetical protein
MVATVIQPSMAVSGILEMWEASPEFGAGVAFRCGRTGVVIGQVTLFRHMRAAVR